MSRLADLDITTALDRLPEWTRDGDVLVRIVPCRDWRDAIAFVNAVAAEADRLDHHPDLCLTRYRRVTLRLTTHTEGGITDLDVALAEAVEAIVGGRG